MHRVDFDWQIPHGTNNSLVPWWSSNQAYDQFGISSSINRWWTQKQELMAKSWLHSGISRRGKR